MEIEKCFRDVFLLKNNLTFICKVKMHEVIEFTHGNYSIKVFILEELCEIEMTDHGSSINNKKYGEIYYNYYGKDIIYLIFNKLKNATDNSSIKIYNDILDISYVPDLMKMNEHIIIKLK